MGALPRRSSRQRRYRRGKKCIKICLLTHSRVLCRGVSSCIGLSAVVDKNLIEKLITELDVLVLGGSSLRKCEASPLSATFRSLCSSYGFDQTTRRCAPQPSDEVGPVEAFGGGAASSSRSPTPFAHSHTHILINSSRAIFGGGRDDLCDVQPKVFCPLRSVKLGFEYQPGCLRANGAFYPQPSYLCRGHTLFAPTPELS